MHVEENKIDEMNTPEYYMCLTMTTMKRLNNIKRFKIHSFIKTAHVLDKSIFCRNV